MPKLNNPLEIYKLLPKTNCKECQCRTCLAFADAVYKGNRKLNECSYLEQQIVQKYSGEITPPVNLQQQQELALENLKMEVSGVDFVSAAERLGAVFDNGKLIVSCLGKNFYIEPNGNITSDCHVNTWITIPLLNYVLYCKGIDFSGTWVPFRELKNGRIRQPLFNQRCEKPMQQIADHDFELFETLLDVFCGKPVLNSFSSDIARILYPLPKIPVLINYRKSEDGFESTFNLFFDAKVEDNLNIESVHMICSGMVVMFEKIALRHGNYYINSVNSKFIS